MTVKSPLNTPLNATPLNIPQQAQEWTPSATQRARGGQLTIKVPVRKLAAGVAIFVGMMAMLGLGATLGTQQPDATTVATLHYAQNHAPAGQTCGAVWLDNASHWAVECGSIGQP